MLRLRISVPLFLISLLFAGHAAAQTPQITIHETVVVTATGKEEPVSQSAPTIAVLTRDQIEQRHALSLVDLLKTVPGVAATRTGGIGGLTSLFARGGESTYNKVLIDGMVMNQPGGAFNFATLSPENIDRIEVLRGAHSALFGSDAMASVIQIFTRRPSGATPQADLTADGGTYNTSHVAGNVGAKPGAIEYSLGASNLTTDNRAPNNHNHTATVSGAAGATQRSGMSERFVARGEFARTGAPGATAFGRADMDAFFKHRDGDFLGSWNQALGSRVTQQAGYSFMLTHQRSSDLIADPTFTPTFGSLVASFPGSDFTYDLGTNLQRHHIDYRLDATVGKNQTLTGALAYDGERGVLTDFMSTAAPQKPSRNNTGTTLQYEATGSRGSLVGGIRFEDNGSFGFYAAPRVAASWLIQSGGANLGATRLHGSMGRGIKEPQFIESYSPSPFFHGNPDLKPERSRGFDASLEQRFAADRVSIEGTYFSNHFDDLISLGPSDPVTFESRYMNVGESRASGFELSGRALAAGPFSLHGAYTFLDSKVIQSTNAFSAVFAAGKPLVRRPRHSGSLQAIFTRSRVTATLSGLFVGTSADFASGFSTLTSNPRHATWQAAGEFRFARGTSGFVTIDNLANRDYMEPLGYPALGRTVRAGVHTRF